MKKLGLLVFLCLSMGCGLADPVSSNTETIRIITPVVNIKSVNSFNIVMDTNNDQKISIEEYKAAADSPQHPSFAYSDDKEQLEAQAKRYISLLDANKDGELGFMECSGEALYTLFFNAQDLNENGKLDKDEFKNYGETLSDVDSLKDKRIVDLVGHQRDVFLALVDDNKDSLVSLQEFLKAGTPSEGSYADSGYAYGQCAAEGVCMPTGYQPQ